MFDTNDVYNDAVKASITHAEYEGEAKKDFVGSKIMVGLLFGSIAYIGYNSKSFIEQALRVKNELIGELHIQSETLAVSKEIEPEEVILLTLPITKQIEPKENNSEEEYLAALREIESELIEPQEMNLDTREQMSLSVAMDSLMDDTVFANNSNYAQELRREIGIVEDEVEKVIIEDKRKGVVQKGDTLQGISNKFYGDVRNYKRIITSNDSLLSNDTIYVGKTILLPY